VALLAVSLVYVAILGVMSRDFGTHWDEASITGSVEKSFETGLMLPRWYNYPSLTYDLALLGALPHAAADAATRFDLRNPGPGSPALVSFLGGPAYRLELRALFFILATALAIAGVVDLVRSNRRTAIWLLSMPVLFVGYISMQHVLLVRNDLILLPVLAVLETLGLAWLLRAASARAPRRIAAAIAALIVAFNLAVATRSAWSIVSPSTVTQKEALERRLSSGADTKFFLSPACQALLA